MKIIEQLLNNIFKNKELGWKYNEDYCRALQALARPLWTLRIKNWLWSKIRIVVLILFIIVEKVGQNEYCNFVELRTYNYGGGIWTDEELAYVGPYHRFIFRSAFFSEHWAAVRSFFFPEGFVKFLSDLIFLMSGLYWLVFFFFFAIALLFAVAYYTLAERKLMGALQRRKGPDVVGFWGLLQPLADGLKLVIKEIIIPQNSIGFLFLLGPAIVFVLSIFGWIVLPSSIEIVPASIPFALLFTLVVLGLNVYGIIIAGWASNSRYPYLGAVRAAAQLLAYELILGMINIIVAMLASSYNYTNIIMMQRIVWFIWPLFPVFIIFLVIILAETNRTPFDLSEAEAELVAGYNLEYSSMYFAFFLGEYANMMLLSLIGVIFFLGGWLPLFWGKFGGAFWLISKAIGFFIFFIWVRATLPRYRYNQLMNLGWKILLPLIFGLFIFYVGLVVYFQIQVVVDINWFRDLHEYRDSLKSFQDLQKIPYGRSWYGFNYEMMQLRGVNYEV